MMVSLHAAVRRLGRKNRLKTTRGKFDTRVYVIHNPIFNMIKIGISRDPETRLITLKSGCGVDLILIRVTPLLIRGSAFSYEKRLHSFFDEHRKGGEWFDDSIIDEAVFYVECIRKNGVYRRKYTGG